MEKKKFSIELPKGGMSDLAKQTISKPHQEPSADATEWQRFIHYLDDFKNVAEHGECVWLLKEVKREVERVKFESNVKLNIRQLVNAMILAFIKEHKEDLKHIRFDCLLCATHLFIIMIT